MAPTDPASMRASTPVGVDVTVHKEARHITDVHQSHKQSNTRVRYYVELVVGSPRASHTRLGFSGTFKALLRLHAAFEALFNAKHAALLKASSRESVSSATSASSASSDGKRASVLGENAPEPPKILPFPTAHALLVKLQPRQHVESDAKAAARCDALFAYYSQLFNSDEKELYLEYIQTRAEAFTRSTDAASSNQDEAVAAEHEPAASGRRAFLKKLFSLRRHDDMESAPPTSEKQRVAALDAKLEFSAPVHVRKPRRWP